MEETRFTDCIKRPAGITGLGSVSGIDVFNIDSVSNSFVFDEGLQLVVAPSAEYSIKSPTSILPLDAFQVLHYDSSCLAIVIYNSFADDVVHISHKPCLLASETFKMPLSRASAFTLETTANFSDFIQSGFHATEELPVGCYSEFAYSDINPNQVRAELELDVFGNKNMNEIIFTFLDDVCTACRPADIFQEVFRYNDWHLDSTIYSGYTDNTLIEFSPEVSNIIFDRNILHPFGFPVLCDYPDGFTCELRRQFSFSSDNRIAFVVDALETTSMPMLKRNPDSFIEFSIRLRNRFINLKFDSDNCFGSHTYYKEHLNLNNYLLKTAIHPTTEVVGFLADGS